MDVRLQLFHAVIGEDNCMKASPRFSGRNKNFQLEPTGCITVSSMLQHNLHTAGALGGPNHICPHLSLQCVNYGEPFVQVEIQRLVLGFCCIFGLK